MNVTYVILRYSIPSTRHITGGNILTCRNNDNVILKFTPSMCSFKSMAFQLQPRLEYAFPISKDTQEPAAAILELIKRQRCLNQGYVKEFSSLFQKKNREGPINNR